MASKSEITECCWCGAPLSDNTFKNRRGERFCSESHRSSSNRALKRFLSKYRMHKNEQP